MPETATIRPEETFDHDEVWVTAIGATARVTIHEAPETDETRAIQAAALPQEVQDALAGVGMRVERVVELTDFTAPVNPDGDSRAVTSDAVMSVAVPPPPSTPTDEYFQVALVVDEWNGITFHLGTIASGADTRDETVQRFDIPLVPAERPTEGPVAGNGSGDDDDETRSIASSILNKVVHVVGYAVAKQVGKAIGSRVVADYEDKQHTHRFRRVTASDLADDGVGDCNDQDWAELATGRSLLLIHGTNSRTGSGLGRLPETLMTDLETAYEGRIWAFDHPTLSQDPMQNVQWIQDNLPADRHLEVDILCHSRGGIVARILRENPTLGGLTPGRIDVHRIVLVGTPNDGTPYADPKELLRFVDVLVNAERWVPENPVTPVIATLLTIVKHVVCGVGEGLPGLMSMKTEGQVLNSLNVPGIDSSGYFALSADYEPAPGTGLAQAMKDTGADLVFKGKANDLVVPTLGSHTAGAGGAFAIPEHARLELPPSRGVNHSTFWTDQEAVDAFSNWLDGGRNAARGNGADVA